MQRITGGVGTGVLAALLLVQGCDMLDLGNREGIDLKSIPPPTYKPAPAKVTGPRIDATPVLEAPAFVGADGVDVYQYPRRLPDRVAMLNLLYLRRFAALEQWMAYFQSEFERDFRKEGWPDRALSAFFVSDPKVTELLDEWVKRSPDHFASWLARGNHRFRMAAHYRGSKWAYQTSAAQFASMEEYHRAASSDLRQAIALSPRLVVAYDRLLSMAKNGSDGEERALHDRATALCPLCYRVRSDYLGAITPRWGGSHAQMQAYIDEVQPLIAQNPKLAVLRGFIPWDRCRSYEETERDRAIADCNEAIAAGAEPQFLISASRLYDVERDPHKVLELLDQALELDPHDREGLERRYGARIDVKSYLGAAEDMIAFRHLDPTEPRLAKDLPWLVDMLRYQGDQLYNAGKQAEALPYFRLGLQLSPDDRDLRRRSGWAQRGEVEVAVADQLAQRPDDFELRLERDHALASQRKFAEVVAMWDEYIIRHGDDPRPYSERGGAKWHLGQRDAARADMQKACDLGLQKACKDAAKMARMP